ncbi:MAG: WD40 repeat domain-containing protein [Omnitrophica WOR_2 bacterium]
MKPFLKMTCALVWLIAYTPSAAAPSLKPLPAKNNSVTQIGEIRLRSWELILALAWSPDGKTLAVAAGNRVYLYDSGSLKETGLQETGAWTNDLSFRKGGRMPLLALATKNGDVQLWNPDTQEQICKFPAHRTGARSVAFDPAGDRLASSGMDAQVRIWDLKPLTQGSCKLPVTAEMIGGSFNVQGVLISPDGSTVLSIDMDKVRLREFESQRLIRTLDAGAPIFDMALSPDGKVLATGEAKRVIQLWDIQSGAEASRWTPAAAPQSGAAGFMWSVAFSPDGKLLAGGCSDHQIYIWKTGDPAESDVLKGHSQAVTSLAFSPGGGILASGSLDGTVKLWKING